VRSRPPRRPGLRRANATSQNPQDSKLPPFRFDCCAFRLTSGVLQHIRGQTGLVLLAMRFTGVDRYCCKSPREAVRPGKLGNSRLRMAGSVNQNSQFGPDARKPFFVRGPKISLQQYRLKTGRRKPAPRKSSWIADS
jgi:hypothetical protein